MRTEKSVFNAFALILLVFGVAQARASHFSGSCPKFNGNYQCRGHDTYTMSINTSVRKGVYSYAINTDGKLANVTADGKYYPAPDDPQGTITSSCIHRELHAKAHYDVDEPHSACINGTLKKIDGIIKWIPKGDGLIDLVTISYTCLYGETVDVQYRNNCEKVRLSPSR
jgi:hypothetical protein